MLINVRESIEFSQLDLLIVLFKNYLSHCVQQKTLSEPFDFFNFICSFDLSSVNQNPNSALNFIIVLGNCIFYNDKNIIELIKTDKIKLFINSIQIDQHQELLQAVKNFLNN